MILFSLLDNFAFVLIVYCFEVSNYERTKVHFLDKIYVFANGKVCFEDGFGFKNKTNESKRLIGFMGNDEFQPKY